jgi:hypothetical protein
VVSPTSSCPRRTNQWQLSTRTRVSQSKTLGNCGLFSCQKILELLATLFATRADLRFRQVIVNIATDIFDKELNDLARGALGQGFGDKTTKSIMISGLIVNDHAGFRRVAHDGIGTFTGSGTTNYLRCSRPINKAAWVRTLGLLVQR